MQIIPKFICHRAAARFLIIIAVMLTPLPANAHRITVFAWVEGSTAHVESKFSAGKGVNEGKVTVTAPDGTILVTGKTDESGAFSFEIPRRTELTVTVSAGLGHQGEWTIRPEEISETDGTADPTAIIERSEPLLPATSASEEIPMPEPGPSPGLSRTEIRQIIEAAMEREWERRLEGKLDEKLAPLMRFLAQQEMKGPTVQDIFAGIGYIFGLVGVAAYVASRRRKPAQERPEGPKGHKGPEVPEVPEVPEGLKEEEEFGA